jgi:hypothetical protein
VTGGLRLDGASRCRKVRSSLQGISKRWPLGLDRHLIQTGDEMDVGGLRNTLSCSIVDRPSLR